MKVQPQIWPRLVNEGGWREQSTGGYWPRYYRVRRGVRQSIRHDPQNLCWRLYLNDRKQPVALGGLTALLSLADT